MKLHGRAEMVKGVGVLLAMLIFFFVFMFFWIGFGQPPTPLPNMLYGIMATAISMFYTGATFWRRLVACVTGAVLSFVLLIILRLLGGAYIGSQMPDNPAALVTNDVFNFVSSIYWLAIVTNILQLAAAHSIAFAIVRVRRLTPA